MATLNVSLPEELKEFVENQVQKQGYVSSSEFLREPARAQLRGLLLEGMESGPGSEMTHDYFERLRERVLESGRQF